MNGKSRHQSIQRILVFNHIKSICRYTHDIAVNEGGHPAVMGMVIGNEMNNPTRSKHTHTSTLSSPPLLGVLPPTDRS